MDDRGWTLGAEQFSDCNALRLARRLGLSTVDELRQSSIDDIGRFWDEVVKDLPIDFFEPYHTVLDASEGPAWTKWFLGGKLNVAWNCVDRHALSDRRDHPALIWEGEDGAVRRMT